MLIHISVQNLRTTDKSGQWKIDDTALLKGSENALGIYVKLAGFMSIDDVECAVVRVLDETTYRAYPITSLRIEEAA